MNAVRVEADSDNSEHVAMFENMLDECYEPYTAMGGNYYPSDILKSCDPIAYNCAFSDFFDDETILGWTCSNCGTNFDSEDEAEDCCSEEDEEDSEIEEDDENVDED